MAIIYSISIEIVLIWPNFLRMATFALSLKLEKPKRIGARVFSSDEIQQHAGKKIIMVATKIDSCPMK
jgi:hypothetical protein